MSDAPTTTKVSNSATIKGYDAFVSYSHSADGNLAPALQRGLQQLGKGWRQRRAMEVFRDETGLAVNPDLWGSIVAALDASDFFLLLASPQAAASKWVGQEIEHCVATKGSDKIIVVLTDGHLAWDPAAGDFSADSDAAHPALRGLLQEAPRIVDLTWARSSTSLTNDNELFRSSIAQIAALMRGSSPEAELTADTTQRNRKRRVVRTALAGLASLAVLALVAAAFAVVNQRDAAAQRDRAEVEAQIALARQFSAQSRTEKDAATAIAMAVEGHALEQTPETEGALLTAVANSGLAKPLTVIPGGFGPEAVYSSSRAGRVSLQLDGPGLVVDLNSKTQWKLPGAGYFLSPDGSLAVGVSGDVLKLADDGSFTKVATLPPGGGPVSFSADGSVVAYLQLPPSGLLQVVVGDTASGKSTVQALPNSSTGCITCEQVAISPDGDQLILRRTSPGIGQLESWAIATVGAPLKNPDTFDVTPSNGMVRFSSDGSRLWTRTGDQIVILDPRTLEAAGPAMSVTRKGPLSFLNDERAVAPADECAPPAIVQAPAMAAIATLPASQQFTEVGCVPEQGYAAWLGDGSYVVTARGVWPTTGPELVQLACDALGGPISSEKFKQMTGVDYEPRGCRVAGGAA